MDNKRRLLKWTSGLLGLVLGVGGIVLLVKAGSDGLLVGLSGFGLLVAACVLPVVLLIKGSSRLAMADPERFADSVAREEENAAVRRSAQAEAAAARQAAPAQPSATPAPPEAVAGGFLLGGQAGLRRASRPTLSDCVARSTNPTGNLAGLVPGGAP